MPRRLFTLASAFSLLLCAAACALWVRTVSGSPSLWPVGRPMAVGISPTTGAEVSEAYLLLSRGGFGYVRRAHARGRGGSGRRR